MISMKQPNKSIFFIVTLNQSIQKEGRSVVLFGNSSRQLFDHAGIAGMRFPFGTSYFEMNNDFEDSE